MTASESHGIERERAVGYHIHSLIRHAAKEMGVPGFGTAFRAKSRTYTEF